MGRKALSTRAFRSANASANGRLSGLKFCRPGGLILLRPAQLVSETLFIKDSFLTLRSQYSKLIPPIRAFLQSAKEVGRPIHIIGQEKTGTFRDHLEGIVRGVAPHERGEPPSYVVLTHE